MPSLIHKVKIIVATNGFTKFLRISDELESYSMQDDPSNKSMLSLDHKEEHEAEKTMKMVELNVSAITISFIHKRNELMTFFMSKLHMHMTATEELNNIKFSIGYL